MLSVQLDNGVILKAIDLGREMQLRTVRPTTKRQCRETWQNVEKTTRDSSFIDEANKQFHLIALSEKASIK